MASEQDLFDEIVEAALAAGPEARPAVLAEAGRLAPALQEELAALLRRHAEAGSFLERPLAAVVRLGKGRFAPGDVLADRFEIERLIAAGGMGEVYAARDRALRDEPVAVKLLLPHVAGAPGARRRFEEEVLLARRVVHPNLCSIYDIFHCPGFSFLTMRLLAGESLAARLSRGRGLPPAEAERIKAQLIAGLAALHSAGILHRDIKPGNVIVDGAGAELRLWITDFGLARAAAWNGSKDTALAGTPGYLAPELLEGAEPSEAGDVYALGRVLHQVYTGSLPGGQGARRTLPHPHHAASAQLRLLLSPNPERRMRAFREAQAADRSSWTRRSFLSAGAASLLGAAAWKRDRLDERLQDWLHPLPAKRFVALAIWPAAHNASSQALLAGLLDQVEGELSRLEPLDHDFFIKAVPSDRELKTQAGLSEARQALGANLILAASDEQGSRGTTVSFTVLDPARGEPLRRRTLSCKAGEETALCADAVRTAAALLDVGRRLEERPAAGSATNSPAALAAFQMAESQRKTLNDTGLEQSIGNYKRAVELDPRYALAYAKLAQAYHALFFIHHDGAAIELAKQNCRTALRLDPRLVEGYLAEARILGEIGQTSDATRALGKGLSIDPDNPRLLAAQVYLFLYLNAWPEAERASARVLDQRPNDSDAHLAAGLVYNAQGKYSRALEAFRMAALCAPGEAMTFSNLSAVYLNLGDSGHAIANALRSLALQRNAHAATNLAAAFRFESRIREALASAAEATVYDPADGQSWMELGACRRTLHPSDPAAVQAYRRGAAALEEQLASDPQDGPSWILLSVCHAGAHARQPALDALAKADQLPSDDLDSQLWKARSLAVLGASVEAQQVLMRCMERGATQYQLRLAPELRALGPIVVGEV